MKGILADINIQGHVDLLVAMMKAEPWKLFWDHLNIQYFHFSDIGLPLNEIDAIVWETCQREGLALITDNRNNNDADSLEATILSRNNSTSLPVFTVANVAHLRSSKQYADRIIDKLLDSLLRIDALRGAGRLYLP